MRRPSEQVLHIFEGAVETLVMNSSAGGGWGRVNTLNTALGLGRSAVLPFLHLGSLLVWFGFF